MLTAVKLIKTLGKAEIMNKAIFEKLIRDHLEAKKIAPSVISDTLCAFSALYERQSYKGKATALVTSAIKEAIATHAKRNKK